MANRVYLELRGAGRPGLLEEDEEDVLRLSCDNGLPLFWLAIIGGPSLPADFRDKARAAFADPQGLTPLDPISLPWSLAKANLTAAGARLSPHPDLAEPFAEWREALDKLAGRDFVTEARLDLAEFAHFHESADRFLSEIEARLRFLDGDPDAPAPEIDDPARDLTGFDDGTGQPFPRVLPAWRPGRTPSPSPSHALGPRLAEWGLSLLVAAAALAAGWAGHLWAGQAGFVGGALAGVLMLSPLIWRWARRSS